MKDLFDKSHEIEVCAKIKKRMLWVSKDDPARSCIPPIKGYESLIVSNENIPSVINIKGDNEIRLKRAIKSSCKIILPITKKDYKDIIENRDNKDKFIEKIKNRKDFKNLVEYVYEHRVSPEKNENENFKENIIKQYEKLMGEIYEVTIKKHQEDKEKLDEV